MNLKELVIKNYRFGFDVSGLVLFLVVMIPNLIWFAVPAPNDILRVPSITPIVDAIGSVFQMLFVGAMCFVISRERKALRFSALIISVLVCVFIYYVGWILYYNGLTEPFVVLMLTISPCLAFVFFAIDRRNIFAAVFALVFSVCHAIFGIANFII